MLPTHNKKPNMSFDSMRVGGGRCPPFIVIILLVTCFILICNWWNLSTTNLTMLAQIEELQEQLKISITERDSCQASKSNLEDRNKYSEKEIASLHVRIQKLNELSKQLKSLENSLEICHSELDSLTKLDATKTATLEARRLDTQKLNAQLESKKEDSLKMQGEIDQLKNNLNQLKQTCKDSNTQKDKTEVEIGDLDKGNKEKDNEDPEDTQVLNAFDETTATEFNDDMAANGKDVIPSLQLH